MCTVVLSPSKKGASLNGSVVRAKLLTKNAARGAGSWEDAALCVRGKLAFRKASQSYRYPRRTANFGTGDKGAAHKPPEVMVWKTGSCIYTVDSSAAAAGGVAKFQFRTPYPRAESMKRTFIPGLPFCTFDFRAPFILKMVLK